MANYLNIQGECKSFGHCKAHVLAELVKSQQIEPEDRKSFLKTFLKAEEKLTFCQFLFRTGVKLSEINWFWAACFNNRQKDKVTYILDEYEEKIYKSLWNKKNKKNLYHFHEIINSRLVDE